MGNKDLDVKETITLKNLGLEITIKSNPEDWNFFMLHPRIKVNREAGTFADRTYYKKSNNISQAKKDAEGYKNELVKMLKDLDSKFAKLSKKNGIDGKKAVDLTETKMIKLKELIQEFSAKAHGKKVKTWEFRSKSNPSKSYETVKWQDGIYSCNCRGWTRRVKNGERICTHVKQVGGTPTKA